MKRLIILTLALTLFSSPAMAEDANWLVEKEGGFSYHAPDSWTLRAIPGLKYRFALAPSGSTFTANINVVDEEFDGTLQAYVDANIDTMSGFFKNFTIISQDPFTTVDDLQGVRLITTNRQNDTDLRQSFFFFQASAGRFFVVTCSDLASNGEALDQTFLEAMITFKVF